MRRTDRIEDAAARWLLTKDRLGAAWSSEQEAQLQAWLAQDVAHRVAWLRLGDAWRQADRLGDEQLSAARPRLRPPPQTAWRRRWPAAAGVMAILAAVLAVAPLQWRGERAAEPTRFATPVGARQFVSLEDGSRVTLNTGTRARSEINPQERQFWLDEGEAYFDVRPDPRRPFVVFAGAQRITVVGTRFSVRRLGAATQVRVEEGRVKVERRAAADPAPVDLAAGAVAEVRSERVALSHETAAQVEQALQWRRGRLTFQGLSLADAAAEFNRYHRRQLVVDAAVADIRIGGSFEADNLDGFVRLAQEGFGLTARGNGERIYLGPPSVGAPSDAPTSPR